MASLPKPVTKTGDSFMGRTFEELIHERQADVTALRSKVSEAGIEGYDDIALVRYLLGFGTVAHTFKAIQAAQDVLREKADVFSSAAARTPLYCADKVEPYIGMVFWEASEDRAIIIIRTSEYNYPELLKHASFDEMVDFTLYFARIIWLWTDGASRRLGRVVKYDAVIDVASSKMSMSAIPPSKFREATNKAAALSEVLHPLVQNKNVFLNIPGASVARRLAALMKPFLPKSISDSIICPGNVSKQSIGVCPYVKHMFASGADSLPTLLGGTCPVSGAYWMSQRVSAQVEDKTADDIAAQKQAGDEALVENVADIEAKLAAMQPNEASDDEGEASI